MNDMRDNLILAVKKALCGSRKIRVTFREGAINYVGFLSTMCDHGIIKINENDLSSLIYASHTLLWNISLSRSIVFTLTDRFNRGWFVDVMNSSFESIEVVE